MLLLCAEEVVEEEVVEVEEEEEGVEEGSTARFHVRMTSTPCFAALLFFRH